MTAESDDILVVDVMQWHVFSLFLFHGGYLFTSNSLNFKVYR